MLESVQRVEIHESALATVECLKDVAVDDMHSPTLCVRFLEEKLRSITNSQPEPSHTALSRRIVPRTSQPVPGTTPNKRANEFGFISTTDTPGL